MNRPRTFVIFLLVLALIVRVAGVLLRHEYVPPEHQIIGAEAGVMARSIAAGQGFVSPYDHAVGPGHPSPSTLLAPVYPYMLAGLLKLGLSMVGVFYVAAAVNLLAGIVLPAITLRIGEAAGFPKTVARLAAVGMCFCPEALRAVGLVWDEALFTMLSALMLWWIIARLRAETTPTLKDPSLLGLASGAIALLNPAMVLALPAAWLAGLQARGATAKRLSQHGVLFIICTLIGSLPWHVRNFFLIDPPAYVFIRGPYWCAAWSSMHPLEPFTRPDGSTGMRALHPWEGGETLDRTDNGFTYHLTEAQYFDWCRERAIAEFRENPRLLFEHVTRQFNSFWLGIAEAQRWHKNPWPFFIAQGIPAIAGIVGLFAARKKIRPAPLAALCAALLVFPVPYYFSDASSRYRHPIDAILFIGAAWGVYLLYQRIMASKP